MQNKCLACAIMTEFSTEMLQFRVNCLYLIAKFFQRAKKKKIKIPTESDCCCLDLYLGKKKKQTFSGKHQHE